MSRSSAVPIARTRQPDETTPAQVDIVALTKQHYDDGYYTKPSRTTAGPFLSSQIKTELETWSPLHSESEALPDDLARRLSTRVSSIVCDNALQRWDGYVVRVCERTFVARLTDLTNKGQADSEEAEISLDDLDDEDRATITPGKIFFWAIGYERTAAGQKKRVSKIKFRQLPRWTPGQLEKAHSEALKLSKEVIWE